MIVLCMYIILYHNYFIYQEYILVHIYHRLLVVSIQHACSLYKTTMMLTLQTKAMSLDSLLAWGICLYGCNYYKSTMP